MSNIWVLGKLILILAGYCVATQDLFLEYLLREHCYMQETIFQIIRKLYSHKNVYFF